MPRRKFDAEELQHEYTSAISEILETYIRNYENYNGITPALHSVFPGRSQTSLMKHLSECEGDTQAALQLMASEEESHVPLRSKLLNHNFVIPTSEILKELDLEYQKCTAVKKHHTYSTDKDYIIARYILAHLHTFVSNFLKNSCVFMKNAKILPSQMLHVFFNVSIFPEKMTSTLSIKYPDYMVAPMYRALNHKTEVLAGTPLKYRINTCMPGSGKTFMMGATALYLLGDEELQKRYIAYHRKQVKSSDSAGFAVVVKQRKTCEVAPVFLYMVPVPLKRQTYDMMVEICKGTGVEVWYDIKNRNMKTAYDSNSKIIWIVPLNTTVTTMLRKEHTYDFLGCGVDEMNSSIGTYGRGMESEPLIVLVSQATPQKLDDDMRNRPNHMLRGAFGNSRLAFPASLPLSFNERAFMKQNFSFTPDFIRQSVNTSAVARMPPGFLVFKLVCKFISLQAIMTGVRGDILSPTSTKQFLKDLLSPHAAQLCSITHEQHATLEARIDNTNSITIETISSILHDASEMIQNERKIERVANAKQSLLRLKHNIDKVFDEKEFECPILALPITRTNAIVLECCNNIISEESNVSMINSHNYRCPFCRTVRQRSVAIGSDEPEGQDSSTIPSEFRYVWNEPLEATVRRLTELELASIDSIKHLVVSCINQTPNARILVTTSQYLSPQHNGLSEIIQYVSSKHRRTKFFITSAARKVKVAEYNNPIKFTCPHVVLLDSTRWSNSPQGLDLYGTDLLISLGEPLGQRDDIMLQSLMRCCRMSNLPQTKHAVVVNLV